MKTSLLSKADMIFDFTTYPLVVTSKAAETFLGGLRKLFGGCFACFSTTMDIRLVHSFGLL